MSREVEKHCRKEFRSYLMAFSVCVLLTLAAFLVVSKQFMGKQGTVLTILGLGVVQLIVQLLVFLHLGTEPKPKWNLLVFSFMALVLVILVFGSLWIMYNLNYRMM